MNIRYITSMLDHFHPEMEQKYPAFEKPVVMPAATVRGNAPMYLRRYIDQDPTSFYMFMKADPQKGDASRECAVRYFKELFYDKLHMPSSYDVAAGGEYSTDQACSKEVLPALDDSNFKNYYEEQMETLYKMMGGEEDADAIKKARIEKLGFDPDDGKTVDVNDLGNYTYGVGGKSAAATRSVGDAQSTAVAMPKPIFYAVDFHAAGGGELGYEGRQALNGRRRSDADIYLNEAKEDQDAEEDSSKDQEMNDMMDDTLSDIGSDDSGSDDSDDSSDIDFDSDDSSEPSIDVDGLKDELKELIDGLDDEDESKEKLQSILDKYFTDDNSDEDDSDEDDSDDSDEEDNSDDDSEEDNSEDDDSDDEDDSEEEKLDESVVRYMNYLARV